MQPISQLRSGLTLLTIALMLAFATAARADQAQAAPGNRQAAISAIGDPATADLGSPMTNPNQVTGAVPGTPAGIAGHPVPADTTAAGIGQSTVTTTPPKTSYTTSNTGTAGNTNPVGNPDAAKKNTGTGQQTRQSQGEQPTAPASGDQSVQPPTSPQPTDTTTGNADPAQQVLQTTGDQATGSGSTGQSAGSTGQSAGGTTSNATSPVPSTTTSPVESNTTSQLIWQVQVSGCTANCQGISQSQVAAQQNNTVQVLTGGLQVVPTSGTPLAPASAPQSTSSITQIQVGCISQCLGTTTSGGAIPQGVEQTVAQVLSLVLASAGLPSQQAAPASEQNVVDQTAHQWQLSRGAAATQTQSASQTNTTVQIVASSLSAALQAAVGASNSSAAEIVNQTEQSIWQVQISCLIFCAQTQQTQQANQSNTTIQVLQSALGATAQTTGAAINSATQVIWQLQIGCLLWCLNTTEQQTAASTQTTLVAIVGPPKTSAPPPDPPSAQGASSSPPTAPAGSHPPSGSAPSADATVSGSVVASEAPAIAAPWTVTFPASPFSAGVPQRSTASGTPLVASSTLSGPAAGAGSGSPALAGLSVPWTLFAFPGSNALPASTTQLGPTTHGVEPSPRRARSGGSDHLAGIARLVRPSLGTFGGILKTAETAVQRTGGISPILPAVAVAAAIALVALFQTQRRSRLSGRGGTH